MKNHIVTIALLIISVVFFAMGFFLNDNLKNYCDIVSFALPTIAAILEIVLAVMTGRKTDAQIKELKEKSNNAVYVGEVIEYVPDIKTNMKQ